MKIAEERLKLLETIFEDYVIAVDKARMEAIAKYHIDVIGVPAAFSDYKPPES